MNKKKEIICSISKCKNKATHKVTWASGVVAYSCEEHPLFIIKGMMVEKIAEPSK